MEEAREIQEKKNKKRGLITSVIFHLLLVLLALLPFLSYPDPPPGQEGVKVNFGAVDMGSGTDQPMTQNEEQVKPQPSAREESEPSSAPAEQEASDIPDDVVTSDKSDAPSAREKEQAAQEKKEQEEARKKADEARKEAEEEARRQKEYEERKKQYGELFDGSGKGNTETAGNQGDPEGEPDAEQLEGISKGSGMVGGGLGERGVVNAPDISDASQKQGTVVMRVCVDQTGKVISSEYTQRGSTTTDSYLIDKAKKSAAQFRFTESEREKQCGTITIVFKLQ